MRTYKTVHIFATDKYKYKETSLEISKMMRDMYDDGYVFESVASSESVLFYTFYKEF